MLLSALEELATALDSHDLDDSGLCRVLSLRTFASLGSIATFFTTVDGEGMMRMRGTFGFPERIASKWRSYPIRDQTPVTDALRQCATIWETDLPRWSPKYPSLPDEDLIDGARSFVCWPIFRGATPVGVMGFCSERELDPSPELEQFFSAVGRLVSLHLRLSSRSVPVAVKATGPPVSVEVLNTLTSRQRLVLERLTDGKTNAQIAAELSYSLGTVRLETMRIYQALGVSNRHEAASAMRRLRPGAVTNDDEATEPRELVAAP